jgi:hypothetical protein
MLTDGIDRYGWDEIGRARYYREYVLELKPVIIRGAFDHWPARRKWNLHFLRDHYRDLRVTVGGSPAKLGEFIEEVLASTEDRPAPYLHNHPMDLWPTDASG